MMQNTDLKLIEATARVDFLEKAMSIENDKICQILGKVLGFPWYKDDQKNFPGATEEDGICQGHYVAEDLANLAAETILNLQEQLAKASRIIHHE